MNFEKPPEDKGTPLDRVRKARELSKQISNMVEGISIAAELETLTRYVEEHPDDKISRKIEIVFDGFVTRAKSKEPKEHDILQDEFNRQVGDLIAEVAESRQ